MRQKHERAGSPTPTPTQLPVFEYKGQVVADSRDIAAMIERPHWIVMRSIRTMSKHLNDNKFVVADYFMEATYIDEKGETRPCFYCTEMGCDMVSNKQEGERGTIFTAQYVRAFHAMRDELAKRRELRAIGKPIRWSLTDALRDSGEVERIRPSTKLPEIPGGFSWMV